MRLDEYRRRCGSCVPKKKLYIYIYYFYLDVFSLTVAWTGNERQSEWSPRLSRAPLDTVLPPRSSTVLPPRSGTSATAAAEAAGRLREVAGTEGVAGEVGFR